MFIPIEAVVMGGMFALMAAGYIAEEVRNKKAASADDADDHQ